MIIILVRKLANLPDYAKRAAARNRRRFLGDYTTQTPPCRRFLGDYTTQTPPGRRLGSYVSFQTPISNVPEVQFVMPAQKWIDKAT